MEYCYIQKEKKWKNISTNEYIEMKANDNKDRIKLYNRYPGINNGQGYSYIDPNDILFFWKDDTMYGECKTPGCFSSFNIPTKYIVDIKKAKELVNNIPEAIMKFVLKYVDIFINDPNYWLQKTDDIDRIITVDRKKIFKLLEENIEPLMTIEQRIAYELEKDELDKVITNFEEKGGR